MAEIPDAQVGTLELYRLLTRVEEAVKALDDKLDKEAVTRAEQGTQIATHELRITRLEETQQTKSTLKTTVLASIPGSLIAAAMVVVQILTQH